MKCRPLYIPPYGSLVYTWWEIPLRVSLFMAFCVSVALFVVVLVEERQGKEALFSGIFLWLSVVSLLGVECHFAELRKDTTPIKRKRTVSV